MPKFRDERQKLSAEFVRSILSYDPASGSFTWRYRTDRSKQWNTRYAGKLAGYISPTTRYLVIEIRRPYVGHQLVWLYMTGEWPKDQIDHRDRDRSNNRFDNLRIATNAQNNCNRVAQSNNSCGHRGIYEHLPGVWRVRINVNKRQIEVGCFPSLNEAIAARKAAELKYHGDFAPDQVPRLSRVSL